MDLRQITIEREKYTIQLTPLQLTSIVKTLGNGCNFLVFGVGNDSSFWLEMNKGGKTIFIEDDKVWAENVKKKNPGIKILMVSYDTKRSNWENLIDHPENLLLKIDDEVTNIKWDVILVDAPKGYEDEHPGRMKSIYQASILIKNKGHVFVHDCERLVERAYTDKYLLKDNLVEEVYNLRHYFMGRNKIIFYKIKDYCFRVYKNFLAVWRKI